MSKLTPGSHALILDANEVKENIGKQVLLMGMVAPGKTAKLTFSTGTYEFDGGPRGVWVVQASGIVRNDIDKGKVIDSYAAVEPRHLMLLPHVLRQASALQPRTQSA